MTKGNDNPGAAAVPPGPFALGGPVGKPDPRRVPLRGDIAHIGLAGRYFVPHYVVPLQRMAGDMGATIHAGPSDESDVIEGLAPGQRFDVLDTSREWAWGCVSLEGPVGYVRLSELLDPFA
ncbi:MAG TPA: SH3 domain-containing protein [Sphingomonadaceae bacterium]|nr:SH3 domain-containing protein [Sphingomonadaceae bacterium]